MSEGAILLVAGLASFGAVFLFYRALFPESVISTRARAYATRRSERGAGGSAPVRAGPAQKSVGMVRALLEYLKQL